MNLIKLIWQVVSHWGFCSNITPPMMPWLSCAEGRIVVIVMPMLCFSHLVTASGCVAALPE